MTLPEKIKILRMLLPDHWHMLPLWSSLMPNFVLMAYF